MVVRELVSRARLGSGDVDLVIMGSAMPLVSSKILAGDDRAKLEGLRSRLNVNGGAVAIGHPVGATGARIVFTLVYELRRRGGGLGVAGICGAMGQGDAIIVRVD